MSDGLIEDIPFDRAHDVSRIRWRLHPLDVGWDLRGEDCDVDMRDAEDILRVSYAAADGERRVMAGPRYTVIRRLRQLGYRVLT